MTTTAYNFIKTDYTSKVKHQTYDANTLAFLLIQSNPGKNLRKQPEYEEAEDALYESTQSCSPEEAINWMRYYQSNAIAYGLATGDTKWGYFFLAACDILDGLRKTYRS